jgi:hypothetical protein
VSPQLPSFIIAGERRAGTTAFYDALAQHPDIALLRPADVNYFTDDLFVGVRSWDERPLHPEAWDAAHGQDEYAALFADLTGGAVGHKGADLLFWDLAHARIMRIVPDVKLLVVLRDPVNRAGSHYLNEVSKGRETLPFGAALASEPDRAELSPYAHFHYSYGERGHYAASLERLFATVPREQVHVVIFEELVLDPAGGLNEVFAFLGIDPLPTPVLPHSNANAALARRPAFDRPPLDAVARFNKRATDSIVRRRVRDHDRKTLWRRRLSWPTHMQLTRKDLPADAVSELRARYADEGTRVGAVLGRAPVAW